MKGLVDVTCSNLMERLDPEALQEEDRVKLQVACAMWLDMSSVRKQCPGLYWLSPTPEPCKNASTSSTLRRGPEPTGPMICTNCHYRWKKIDKK